MKKPTHTTLKRSTPFTTNGGLRAVRKKESTGPRVLRLTLSAAPFAVMQSNEKLLEFRKPSDWIKVRLIDKKTGQPRPYDQVEFVNGYGAEKPRFSRGYIGFYVAEEPLDITYSNGLRVLVEPGDYVLALHSKKP